MEQNNAVQSLGQRLASAARLAVELHLIADQLGKSKQRDLNGGTDSSARCTADGCCHAEHPIADPVTDDTMAPM
jgi:hypothetical protein